MRNLDISNNEITDKSIKALNELFEDNKTVINLNVLDLKKNKIGDDGVQLLANLLIHNKDKILCIKSLNLDSNKFYCQGAFGIAKIINENLNIETLTISSNFIKSDGIAKIFRALTINKKLKSIDLSKNLYEKNKSYYFLDSLPIVKINELVLSGIKSFKYDDYLNFFHG